MINLVLLESHGWAKYQSGEYLFKREDIKVGKKRGLNFSTFLSKSACNIWSQKIYFHLPSNFFYMNCGKKSGDIDAFFCKSYGK